MLFRSYGSGVNTGGTAEDWYKKGVASSIRVMNELALEAQSETAFSGNGEAEINAYLADPDVQLNGINDMERIYRSAERRDRKECGCTGMSRWLRYNQKTQVTNNTTGVHNHT